MKKYTSDTYTIFVNNNSVTMMDNNTNMAHSLSNLTTGDIAYQDLGSQEKAEKFEQLILTANINKLNELTGEGFVAAA